MALFSAAASYSWSMDRDIAKLQNISRDLSQLGIELMHREAPLDAEYGAKIGEAFVAVSEAVADVSAALERGAQAARENAMNSNDVKPETA